MSENLVFNFEVFHDFCGTFHQFTYHDANKDSTQAHLAMFPEVLYNYVVHGFANRDMNIGSTEITAKNLYNNMKDVVVTNTPDDVKELLLDSDNWKNPETINKVGTYIKRFTEICDIWRIYDAVWDSDYYKVYRKLHEIQDEDRNLYDVMYKNINWNNLSKVNFDLVKM